ncbi:MAG: hypothetical protein AAGF77_06165 [Bacteroidota bacterium]
MEDDLKTRFEKEREQEVPPMRVGHEDRFLQRLEEKLPLSKARPIGRWLQIAALFALALTVGGVLIWNKGTEAAQQNSITVTESPQNKLDPDTTISLGDLSPDLQKIEDYYVVQINMELAGLEVSPENKAMVDAFMERLADLDETYSILVTELNEFGPNEATIGALIQNLQLRLQLLQRLKQKLNQLKTIANEQQIRHL